MNAEHALQLVHAVGKVLLPDAVHEDASLFALHARCNRMQRLFDAIDQKPFEERAVQSL